MPLITPALIAALPPAPSPNDPTNFDGEADAFVAALAQLRSETNTISEANFNNAVIAYDSAASALVSEQNAAASATAAATSANASLWVSGTPYALDVSVISPMDRQTYRRIVAGAGTTDPKLDNTNWTCISGTPRAKLHAISLYF
jgi:hypothetical protein